MRRHGVRAGAVLVCLALASLGALHLHHRRTLDLSAIEAALRERTARAQELARRAGEASPEARLATLPPGPFNGPGLRLERLLESAQVTPPPSEPRPVAPERRLSFEFDGADPFPLSSGSSRERLEDGLLHVEHREGDALVSAAGFEAGPEPLAEVAIRIRLEKGSTFTLGWSRRPLGAWSEKPGWLSRFEVDVVPDGEFHVYRVDASHAMRIREGKRIRTLLLIPSNLPGDRVTIDWVRVVTQRARYADPSVGRTSLSRGGELRTALHASAPRSLAFAVSVPQDGPRLDLGLGILDAAEPVEFRVELEQDGTRRELARRRIADAHTWHDLRIELAHFAGRDAVLHLQLSGEAGAVGLIANPRITSEPKERLNVLVVVEDTLRADHLGAWGHDRATSPHKDRLAREGVVFERAYSQATKTRPSVPSYLTSLLPAATGVWSFHDRLDARYVTLAEVLRQQGFETASFVQNSNAGPAAGVHQGFDRLRSQRTMEFRPDRIYRGVLLDWIAEQRDRNWHAYVHVLDPHGPYDPPAPHDAWHREERGGTPVDRDPLLDPSSVEAPTREGRLARYDGEIANNDEWFGGLLERLDELGIADHTLIVFFSDHGEHQGEHGIWEHSPPGFAPVLHVPLLFWLPARVPSGLRVAEPVSLLDVMPTILALAGVDTDRLLLQGRAMLPPGGALASAVVSEEAIAYERERPERVRGSVFAGPWQLIYTRHQGTKALRMLDLRDGTASARFALPSLGWDPLLERSLLARLRALKRANLALSEAIAHADREVIQMDPEDREQLRALGYIE